MKLTEFKNALAQNPDAHIRFLLPNGELTPAHAHVTEVARIDKHFVDCGGAVRTDAICRLQTWVADDLDHRLTAGKLLRILEIAKPLLKSEDLEIDVEHELDYISQFPIASVKATATELVFQLSTRHTACLAQDQCCAPKPSLSDFRPLTFQPTRS
jgi:hypothetical protein